MNVIVGSLCAFWHLWCCFRRGKGGGAGAPVHNHGGGDEGCIDCADGRVVVLVVKGG